MRAHTAREGGWVLAEQLEEHHRAHIARGDAGGADPDESLHTGHGHQRAVAAPGRSRPSGPLIGLQAPRGARSNGEFDPGSG